MSCVTTVVSFTFVLQEQEGRQDQSQTLTETAWTRSSVSV